MQVLAFADLTNRKLNSTLGGSTLTLPELVQGDEIRIGLRFSEQIEGTATEVTRTLNSLRASIGLVDARPTGGTFQLFVDGDSVGSPLAFDATAAQVQAALDAAYTSSVTVTSKDGSWLVDVTDATEANYPITGTSVNLEPSCHVRVRSYLVGAKKRHEIRLIRSPFASTSIFSNIVPAAPEIIRVQEGGNQGTTTWNEIQALKINPNFRGTYQISRGYKRSGELSIEDGAEEIQAAIANLADDEGTLTVTNPSNNTAHITFGGSMGGLPQELLEVEVFSAPPGDPTFVLNLNTAELADALRAVDNITTAVLEVEMTIEDENDPETLYTVRPIREPVRIIRELNWEGLETAANIDWLRPPHGRTYVPFTPSQIITGSQHYVAPIGDGANTEYTLTHNLGTRDLHVTLRKNDGESAIVDRQFSLDGEDLYISYAVTLDSEDDLTIKFKTPPTSNQYVATITTAGPVSAFQAHTHTIEQIEGLQLIINDLGGRMESLETLVVATGPGNNETTESSALQMKVEKVDIAIPAGSSTSTRPMLLGSINDATIESVSVPLATPESIPGQVKQINSAWTIPAGRNRRAWPVKSGGYIASNGNVLYEVRKVGNTYYPVEFEHDIFMVWISAEMLTAKRTLSLTAKPVLQLLGNTRAQYTLDVAFGTVVEDSGSGFGPNLASITWAEPIISQKIILSSTIVEHPFGLVVKSDPSAVLTATSTIYGRTQNATPPSSAAFAIRARLNNFDTENRQNPRGSISLTAKEEDIKISIQ
jgi:hypothetical protein